LHACVHVCIHTYIHTPVHTISAHPGASSRTIVLYHLGSVVLKQRRTGFTEWFYNSVKTGALISVLCK